MTCIILILKNKNFINRVGPKARSPQRVGLGQIYLEFCSLLN